MKKARNYWTFTTFHNIVYIFYHFHMLTIWKYLYNSWYI